MPSAMLCTARQADRATNLSSHQQRQQPHQEQQQQHRPLNGSLEVTGPPGETEKGQQPPLTSELPEIGQERRPGKAQLHEEPPRGFPAGGEGLIPSLGLRKALDFSTSVWRDSRAVVVGVLAQ